MEDGYLAIVIKIRQTKESQFVLNPIKVIGKLQYMKNCSKDSNWIAFHGSVIKKTDKQYYEYYEWTDRYYYEWTNEYYKWADEWTDEYHEWIDEYRRWITVYYEWINEYYEWEKSITSN